MEPIQQYIAMAFGAAVAVSGLALMLLGHRDSGRNAIEIWGQKIELSTPALAVFLVGSAIFVMPFFLSREAPLSWSRTQWTAPKASAAPEDTPDSGDPRSLQPVFETNASGIVAELTDFSMAGELASLSFRVVARQSGALCIEPENATLMDEQTGQEWNPVSFSKASECKFYLAGQREAIWMHFPTGSAAQTTFTARVPGIADPVKGLRLAKPATG